MRSISPRTIQSRVALVLDDRARSVRMNLSVLRCRLSPWTRTTAAAAPLPRRRLRRHRRSADSLQRVCRAARGVDARRRALGFSWRAALARNAGMLLALYARPWPYEAATPGLPPMWCLLLDRPRCGHEKLLAHGRGAFYWGRFNRSEQ